MTDSVPKQLPPYGLRMPPELKRRVQNAADKNNRSLNMEINAALEEKYPTPLEGLDLKRIREILDELDRTRIKPGNSLSDEEYEKLDAEYKVAWAEYRSIFPERTQ